MLNFTANRNLYYVEIRVLIMSNINKQEFQTFSWKTSWSLFLTGLMCLIASPVFLFTKGDIGTQMLLALLFLGMGVISIFSYFSNLFNKEHRILTEDERKADLKKDLSKYISGYYVRPRIEGHEEDLRKNLKIVLTELADEY